MWQGLPYVLWQTVPFKDPDAFEDWHLQHFLHHQVLAAKTGTALVTLDSLRTDPFPHSTMHANVAAKLGLPVTFDFADVDLRDQDGYYNFMLAHSNHHSQLASKAGV